MHSFDFDEIVIGLVKRTHHAVKRAAGAERQPRLQARLEQLYGALELARLLRYHQLASRIETHIETFRRTLEER
jgi:hypothetical protein